MVTDFIKQQDVKAFLKKHFPKPILEKPLLIIEDKPIYPQAIGQAMEYFISCHLDFLYPVSKRDFDKNQFMKDIRLNFENLNQMKSSLFHHKFRIAFDDAINSLLTEIQKPTSKLNPKNIQKEIDSEKDMGWAHIITYQKAGDLKTYLPEISISNKEILTIGKIDSFLEYFETFKPIYKKYLQNGKLTDEFLIYLLTLPKIRTSIVPLFDFGNNLGRYAEEDLLILRKLIKQIPKSIFGKSRKTFYESQSQIMSGLIYGKPDFKIENGILEIKTTKDFFTQEHYHQLIAYFLLHVHSIESIENIKKWSDKDLIRNCSIKKLCIYYSYYGKMVMFDTTRFLKTESFKNTYIAFRNLDGI